MKLTRENTVMFWKGEDFLSNFHPVNLEYKGHKLYCSEQLFMIMKAEFFNQPEYVDKLISLGDVFPNNYRKLGREIPGWEEYGELWDANKNDVMLEALMIKFAEPTMQKLLLDTEDKILIEASPFDTYWGIGLSATRRKAFDKSQWRGQNQLGELLMIVREHYRQAQ